MKGIKDPLSTYLLDTWLVTLKGTLLRGVVGEKVKAKTRNRAGYYRGIIEIVHSWNNS